ncbi:tRNA uridine-5-carboxymethylaminomethyl(34) synthesis GTPase MnmE [Candidatus Pelagibacter sp.]|uniref:tRNA uridine-5-carboxymethylaminomethyl(34) synthesis GTPase MnmE n=1 Tax=Candidatus Pelagibacter sp. TaxID=2024849 RepID=UPI003F8718CA
MIIYALSTGTTKAGIAIIRISGNGTKELLNKIIVNCILKPRIATLCKIKDHITNDLIDRGLFIWFPAPSSFTGEDMAELHVHGSKAVISALLLTLSKFNNCRLAEPGEFTKLAYENGKLNLLSVEALSDLISSETEIQRKQALKILSGDATKKYTNLRDRLLKILSNIEAKIDFPDEDLPEDILKNIKIETKDIINLINEILNDSKTGEKIRDGFKISILGPTNAGKSTLLNYLSKREVAIVSNTEGTTRDLIEVNLNLDGYPVIITDTAGLRKTSDEIERRGVELALKSAKNADLKIILLDAKNPYFSTFLDDISDKNSILVLNKSDLIDGAINLDNAKLKKYILVSLKEELNLDNLINEIKERLKDKFLINDNILISRERHRLNLEKCNYHLNVFLENNSISEFDKAAEDIRIASRYLGKVVGDVDVEEVLGKIFSDFCIGK